jgi:hypothetical protein
MNDLKLDLLTVKLIAQVFDGKKCYICGEQATNISDIGHKRVEYVCRIHTRNHAQEQYVSSRRMVSIDTGRRYLIYEE